MADSVYAEFVRGLTPRTYHNAIGQVIPSTKDGDVLHAMFGIASESGEIVDVFKKRFAYGKEIDYVNLDEEMGDLLWYIQLYANARNKTLADLIQMNMDKLAKRYKDNLFTSKDALNRNLEQERQALEAANGSGQNSVS